MFNQVLVDDIDIDLDHLISAQGSAALGLPLLRVVKDRIY